MSESRYACLLVEGGSRLQSLSGRLRRDTGSLDLRFAHSFDCPCAPAGAGDRPPERAVARTAPTASCKDRHSLPSLGITLSLTRPPTRHSHSLTHSLWHARFPRACCARAFPRGLLAGTRARNANATRTRNANFEPPRLMPVASPETHGHRGAAPESGARTARRYAGTWSSERLASFVRRRRRACSGGMQMGTQIRGYAELQADAARGRHSRIGTSRVR